MNKTLEYMQSTSWGKTLLAIDDDLKKVKLFKFLFGIEYSFSVLFILTVLTWIVLLVYVYRSLFVFDIWLMEREQSTTAIKLGLTFLVGVAFSWIGLTPGIALILSVPQYLVFTVILVALSLIIQRVIYSYYPIDTPLRQIAVMLISGALGLIITYIIALIPGLISFIAWLTTLPSWLNKLITIILFVFLIYYSSAYSKTLNKYFASMKRKKQLRIMQNKIDKLEKKKDEEGTLSIEERKEKEMAERMLIALGKELEGEAGKEE